jgi:hypothetical protein
MDTVAMELEAVTMHVTPDVYAVQVLGQASGRVQTMCGPVGVSWHAERGRHFSTTSVT